MRKTCRFCRPPIASDFPLPPPGGDGGVDFLVIFFLVSAALILGSLTYHYSLTPNSLGLESLNSKNALLEKENLKTLCNNLSDPFPNDTTKAICEHLNDYYISSSSLNETPVNIDVAVTVLDTVTKT